MTAIAILIVAVIAAIAWARSRARAFEKRSNVFNPAEPLLDVLGFAVILVATLAALVIWA